MIVKSMTTMMTTKGLDWRLVVAEAAGLVEAVRVEMVGEMVGERVMVASVRIVVVVAEVVAEEVAELVVVAEVELDLLHLKHPVTATLCVLIMIARMEFLLGGVGEEGAVVVDERVETLVKSIPGEVVREVGAGENHAQHLLSKTFHE